MQNEFIEYLIMYIFSYKHLPTFYKYYNKIYMIYKGDIHYLFNYSTLSIQLYKSYLFHEIQLIYYVL